MVEDRIADLCAPTLAGIKCGSLFRTDDGSDIVSEEIDGINSQLHPHGITVTLFSATCGTLVYVYRDDLLRRISESDKRSVDRLRDLGYCTGSTEALVESLRRKTEEQGCVPHEIGLFLGYPYDDVVGFMRDGGKNPKCAGCWKVYGSVEKAKDMFSRFRRCRDDYRMRYRSGIPLSDLAI